MNSGMFSMISKANKRDAILIACCLALFWGLMYQGCIILYTSDRQELFAK